jgi:hypothetical protein
VRTQVPELDEAELRAFLIAQPRVIGDAPLISRFFRSCRMRSRATAS